ncbi:hypothetical protein [Sphingomonas sanguinis]|uniref:Uncharacterized protein n=1 Tax=Sphingomonas sanguinis TaxID=33051 RepID=A0A147HV95_9SPHN|nr:hypothetical protein [Sphingomonas sanguinis]KTT68800.1 hypothetical protein NS319_12240 [Sphingomonas sanguinis]
MSDGADFGGAADLIGGAATGGDAGTAGAGSDGGAGSAAAGAADGGQGGDGGAAPDWFANVSDKLGEGETASNRDWLGSLGIKDLDGLVKVARDNQRAVRESGRVKVPGEGAQPDEVTAFHRAIGVPEKAEGYEIKGPEGVQLNDAVLSQLAEAGVKHGIPKAAFEGIVSDFIQIQMADADAEKQRQDGLASEWVKAQGGKADEQIAHVNSAVRALGLTKADMAGLRTGMGADRALGLLAKLGAGMAEDVMITGGSNRFGVSGAEAQAELNRLMSDSDFKAKAMKEGTPERQRWDRLNKQAAEYQASKAA